MHRPELRADVIECLGNLKYDLTPPGKLSPELSKFFDSLEKCQVWVAASTMAPAADGDPDEDETVIQAFQSLAEEHPDLLLVLAPRHPERFDAVAAKLGKTGVRYARRSELSSSGAEQESRRLPGVLLLDTIGELAAVFERADVVFMGGTLVSRGGHNILEPAYFGKPVIVGPHMENFAEIAAAFRCPGRAGGDRRRRGTARGRRLGCCAIEKMPRKIGASGRRRSLRPIAAWSGRSPRRWWTRWRTRFRLRWRRCRSA